MVACPDSGRLHMSQRKQAVGRIWALLWQAVIGYLLAIVIGVLAMAWMVVDILWQLITGRGGLSSSSKPAKWIKRTLEWSMGQTLYAITGGGDRKWKALP